MALYKAQVSIFPTSNLAADAVTNTWCFQAYDDAAMAVARASLVTFYQSLVTVYPATVRTLNHNIKVYDLDDPEPRQPVTDTTFNFPSAPNGATLPSECACCLSFEGVRISGAPQNRRRGRVFIGPLDAALLDVDGRFGTSVLTSIRNAADVLKAASDASGLWEWGIHSPLTLGDFVRVNSGWIDNAVDIQRRRGILPTVRSVLSVPG